MTSKISNPNCDGSLCRSATGQVRVLPVSEQGNIILCRACYRIEMTWRRERNKELSAAVSYPLPDWNSLELYGATP